MLNIINATSEAEADGIQESTFCSETGYEENLCHL